MPISPSTPRLPRRIPLSRATIVCMLTLTLLLAASILTPAHAATQGVAEPPDNINTVDGAVTTATAYHIATLGNLVWLHDEAAAGRTTNKYYHLTQDIDASDTANWNDPGTSLSRLEGFIPIGDATNKFAGILDGNGYKITKLTINRPTATAPVGLLGYAYYVITTTGKTTGIARISNLRLDDCSIAGAGTVGGLVGDMQYGIITNCSVTGQVAGGSLVGGLVGNGAFGTMVDCSASGTVSGIDNNVGGIAGNCPAIKYCQVNGTVTGKNYVGGMVGGGTSVSNSTVMGSVSGTTYVGGLAGTGNVTNCQANATVYANNYVGGIVGIGTSISDCTAAGQITGSNRVGGISGSSSTITNCQSSATVNGSTDYVGGVVGICSTNLTNCSATGSVNGGRYVGGVAGACSAMTSCQSNIATVNAGGYAGGLVGSASGKVSNCQSVSNVTATGTTGYVGGLIGFATGSVLDSSATGAVTAVNATNVGGLIGMLSTITYPMKGCSATGAVSGATNVGGLIGNLNASISYCSASGSVSGVDAIGGLLGIIQGQRVIANCSATGAVTARYHAAGLVALSSTGSNIIYCYAAGPVTVTPDLPTSETCVGGLIGSNFARIQDCYASGATLLKLNPSALYTGGLFLGGLVGRNVGVGPQVISSYACGPVAMLSTINGKPLHPANVNVGGLNGNVSDDTLLFDCFWDSQTTGQPTSAGGLGLGLTTVQMRDIATRTNWDFIYTWGMQGGYPYLRGLPTCTVTYRAAAHGTLGLDPGAGLTEFPQVLNPGARLMPVLAEGTPGFPFRRWSDGLTTNPRTDAGLLADTTLTAFFGTSTAARHWPAYE